MKIILLIGFIQMALGHLINQGLPIDSRTLPPPPPLWTTGIVVSSGFLDPHEIKVLTVNKF